MKFFSFSGGGNPILSDRISLKIPNGMLMGTLWGPRDTSPPRTSRIVPILIGPGPMHLRNNGCSTNFGDVYCTILPLPIPSLRPRLKIAMAKDQGSPCYWLTLWQVKCRCDWLPFIVLPGITPYTRRAFWHPRPMEF